MQSLSEKVKVVQFESHEDKLKAFHELLTSKSNFTGIGGQRYALTEKQRKILKDKRIHFKEID